MAPPLVATSAPAALASAEALGDGGRRDIRPGRCVRGGLRPRVCPSSGHLKIQNLRPLLIVTHDGYRPSFQDPGMTSVAVAAPGRLPLPLQLSHAPKACETTSSSALERQEPSLTSWGNPDRAGAGGQGHRSRRNRHHASISVVLRLRGGGQWGTGKGGTEQKPLKQATAFQRVPSRTIPLHPIAAHYVSSVQSAGLRCVGRVQSWPSTISHTRDLLVIACTSASASISPTIRLVYCHGYCERHRRRVAGGRPIAGTPPHHHPIALVLLVTAIIAKATF